MRFRNIILLILPLLFVLASCSKNKCDAEKQAQIDDAAIVKFLADKDIVARKHESGIYYQVINSGSGNITYTANTTVTAKYTGRVLSGGQFDQSTQGASFQLGGVITGWQIGVPLIQKGGKIRLFIPSGLGYGCDGSSDGSIPPNTVLDFDIELVNVTN